MRVFYSEAIYEDMYDEPAPDARISLVYFGDVRHRPGHTITPHVHGYYEISLIAEGSADYMVDDRTYPLSIGDVCITKPGEMHTMKGRSSSEWEVYYAAFESIGIGELDKILRDTGVQSITGCSDLLPEFERILKTARQPRLGNMQIARLLVDTWVIQIIQRLGYSESKHIEYLKSGVVEEARAYIERHARHKLSLAEISRAVGLSRSRLAHRFSEEMKCSIYGYVRQVLMQRALRLLEDGRMNISEISETLEFPSIYCFSSSFKRYWGFSPTEYRQTLTRNHGMHSQV